MKTSTWLILGTGTAVGGWAAWKYIIYPNMYRIYPELFREKVTEVAVEKLAELPAIIEAAPKVLSGYIDAIGAKFGWSAGSKDKPKDNDTPAADEAAADEAVAPDEAAADEAAATEGDGSTSAWGYGETTPSDKKWAERAAALRPMSRTRGAEHGKFSRSKGYRPWIHREGKLGGPGYSHRPARTRHRILNHAVRKYGYRSTLGSLMVLLRNHEIHPDVARAIHDDKEWLVKKYGGPGSFGGSKL